MNTNRKKGSSLIKDLLNRLNLFNNLKRARWEQVEESIQMSNKLGVPSEDWITPPDENSVETILLADPEYVEIKKDILKLVPLVKELADEQGFDLKHRLDWIRFTDPLVGTAAINDALEILKDFKDYKSELR